jgi:RNA recognition motif-containing protein
MTLLHGTRVSNERLIFVKNVPSYVPDDQIAELFAPYHPVSFKNIYKGSSITTIVVGFRSTGDAARAQRETDGKPLGSAVIKVEIYEPRRSIRYLREHEQAKIPLDVEEEDDTELPGEEIVPKEVSTHFPPLYPAPVELPSTAPQSTTWARIASNQRAQGVTNAPAITKADEAHTPASTPIVTPQIPIVVPVEALEPEPQALQPSSSPSVSLNNSITSVMSAPPAHDDSSDGNEETEIGYYARKCHEILGWAQHSSNNIQEMQLGLGEPADTTVRIRYRHCGGCTFCKMRERNCSRLG